MLYEELDKWPKAYTVVPDKSARSRMNVCFRVSGADAEKEKAWLAEAEKRGLLALKGHRSVGGIRASNCEFLNVLVHVYYLKLERWAIANTPSVILDNAVSVEAVEKLVKYLAEYAQSQE